FDNGVVLGRRGLCPNGRWQHAFCEVVYTLKLSASACWCHLTGVKENFEGDFCWTPGPPPFAVVALCVAWADVLADFATREWTMIRDNLANQGDEIGMLRLNRCQRFTRFRVHARPTTTFPSQERKRAGWHVCGFVCPSFHNASRSAPRRSIHQGGVVWSQPR